MRPVPVPHLDRAPSLLARFMTAIWAHDTRSVRAFRRIALDLKTGTVIEIKESLGSLAWQEFRENTTKCLFILLCVIVSTVWLEYHHRLSTRLAFALASTLLVQ